MTASVPHRGARVVSILLGAVLIAFALVFREELISWFTGWQNPPLHKPADEQGEAAKPAQPAQFDSATLDGLRAATAAYEQIRAALSRDELSGVETPSRTLAEALTAAAMTSTAADKASFVNAAAHSRTLADASDLDAARRLFAELNAQLLPLLGRDSRLVQGTHVFECPMFQHARWFQPRPAIENPYMGSRMLGCGTESDWHSNQDRLQGSSPAADSAIDHYTCSMHPSVNQPGPGKCPICGMDLIAVTAQQQRDGIVLIDEARRQLIGVRTGPVVEAPMRRGVRVLGKVAYDESALTDVNLKVSGWITKLLVNQTGQRVTRGQALFTLYSPDLYSAQQDLQLALRATREPSGGSARADQLVRVARKRLSLLGLPDTQIDEIARAAEPLDAITISSPATGFVIEKDVFEGAFVQAGVRLFRIAALDRVWIEGDVYEEDLRLVRVGQAAAVTLDYLPARSYAGKVSYVYPYLTSEARTGRVRIELANKVLELRPGMYARVELSSELGPRLQVPASALVYTGPRRLVFVDLGEGRFKPQEIKTGIEAGGMFEVIDGLKAGDVVATSGMFLIAAEARISTATKYWETDAPASNTEHGAHE